MVKEIKRQPQRTGSLTNFCMHDLFGLNYCLLNRNARLWLIFVNCPITRLYSPVRPSYIFLGLPLGPRPFSCSSSNCHLSCDCSAFSCTDITLSVFPPVFFRKIISMLSSILAVLLVSAHDYVNVDITY